MKVLFAVSNEEISESIIKRYQSEYKQIISSKNVYYFNAILKEIQKDKTYDRIVISEDLEAFSHTQYDQIDKFIFDKLDSISDEASNVKGKDTPIILICSDRRTKSEQILVKLFGLGVYNALIGADRSVEEVCKLLNRSRTKKEAKSYYKIDSEEVKYKAENENDVSEIEIQNILAHYKKLGKNEDRYVDSFNNIAAQYNDIQLRIISKFLPLNVRAVLEENSQKYQKIMSFNNAVTDNLRKSKNDNESDGPTSKLLTSKVREMPIGGPVVIPSEVNLNTVKKLSRNKKIVNMQAPEQKERQKNQGQAIQDTNINRRYNSNQQEERPIYQQKHQEAQIENKYQQPVVKQNEQQNSYQNQINTREEEQENEQQKRGRGRPRKTAVIPTQSGSSPKRGRGRPKKEDINQEFVNTTQTVNSTILPEFEEIEEYTNNNTNRYNQPTQNEQYSSSKQEQSTMLPGFDNFEDDEDNNNYNKMANTQYNKQEQSTMLPGFDNFEDDENNNNYNQMANTQYNKQEQSTMLPGFDNFEEGEEDNNKNNPYNIKTETALSEEENYSPSNNPLEDIYNSRNNATIENNYNKGYQNNTYTQTKKEPIEELRNYNTKNENQINKRPEYINTIDLSQFLTPDKKIVSFLGTSKNGTSFIVNNLAEILSSMGVKTAILDTTTNRNSYYIYTKNEEDLRNIATGTLDSLAEGISQGIQVNKNLTVFTSLPEENEKIDSVDEILETLVKNFSLILIDTDFNTPMGYFKQSQELYLVQTLDILTIQPLTAFLRELKAKNILEEEKVRIIINKAVKVKGISEKTIIGGMAFYNDPAMSFMTELFDRNMVKYITIPFEEETYIKYLENIINCEISLKGYSKMFMQSLRELGNMVYPIVSTGKPQTGYKPQAGYNNGGKDGFSPSINTTLNQMKRNY